MIYIFRALQKHCVYNNEDEDNTLNTLNKDISLR